MLNVKVVARKFLMLSLSASFLLAPTMPAYAGAGVCKEMFEGPKIEEHTLMYEEVLAELKGKDATILEIQKLKKDLAKIRAKNKNYATKADSEAEDSLIEFHYLLLTNGVKTVIDHFSNLIVDTEGAFLLFKIRTAVIAKLKEDVARNRVDHGKAQVMIEKLEIEAAAAREAYWLGRDAYFGVRMDLSRTISQQKLQDPQAILNEVAIQMLTVDNAIQAAQTELNLPGPMVGYNNAPVPGAPAAPAPLSPLQPLQPLIPAVHIPSPIIPGVIEAKVDAKPAVKADDDDDGDDDDKPKNQAALTLNAQQLQIPGLAPAAAPGAAPAPAVPTAAAPAPGAAPVVPAPVVPAPVVPAPVVPAPAPVVVIPPKALDATQALNAARQIDLAFSSYLDRSDFQASFKSYKKILGEDYKIQRPTLEEMFAFDRKQSNTNEAIISQLNKQIIAENKLYRWSFIKQPEFVEAVGNVTAYMPASTVQPVTKLFMVPHDNMVVKRFKASILEVMSIPFEGAGVDHLTRVEKLFDLNVRYPGDQLLVAYARVVRGSRSWTDMKLTLSNEAFNVPYGKDQVVKQQKYADWVARMTEAEKRANTLGDLSLRERVSPQYMFMSSVIAGGGFVSYYYGPKLYEFLTHVDFPGWLHTIATTAHLVH